MRKKAVFVTLAFVVLALLAARLYREHTDSVAKMRELTLRQDLLVMRALVDQFILDKHKRPQSFDDLVAAGYLKQVPTDPMTGRNDTWVLEWSDDPKTPGIVGIRTGSSSGKGNAYGDGKMEPHQGFTGYPPSVYMQQFHACSSNAPCTRETEFRIDPVPSGCCVLTVTNGDGLGKEEVRSYEVFLNSHRVIPADSSRNAQAVVTVVRRNTLKVILVGQPSSKVSILVSFPPLLDVWRELPASSGRICQKALARVANEC